VPFRSALEEGKTSDSRTRQIVAVTLEDFYDPDTEYYDAEGAGDSLAQTMCKVFAAINDRFAVALIATASHRIERLHYPSYTWRISTPPEVYAVYLKQNEIAEPFESKAQKYGGPHFENIYAIVVQPRLEQASGWQQTIINEYFKGDRREW
jgi:hypothetical protein